MRLRERLRRDRVGVTLGPLTTSILIGRSCPPGASRPSGPARRTCRRDASVSRSARVWSVSVTGAAQQDGAGLGGGAHPALHLVRGEADRVLGHHALRQPVAAEQVGVRLDALLEEEAALVGVGDALVGGGDEEGHRGDVPGLRRTVTRAATPRATMTVSSTSHQCVGRPGGNHERPSAGKPPSGPCGRLVKHKSSSAVTGRSPAPTPPPSAFGSTDCGGRKRSKCRKRPIRQSIAINRAARVAEFVRNNCPGTREVTYDAADGCRSAARRGRAAGDGGPGGSPADGQRVRDELRRQGDPGQPGRGRRPSRRGGPRLRVRRWGRLPSPPPAGLSGGARPARPPRTARSPR